MPSFIAWAAAILAALISKGLPMPLAFIQLFVPFPTLFAFLRFPFAKMATLVMLAGSVLQTGMLVEEVLADKAGTWLNSAAKSSTPASPSLPSLRSAVSSAEVQLAEFSSLAYPKAVAALLDNALALPSIPEGSDIAYTAHDIEEWESQSALFRSEFGRLADETARAWVDVLSYNPSASASASYDSAPPPLFLPNSTYLQAVQAELVALQAGRPTMAVYTASEYTDEDWTRFEREKEEKERAEKEKKDKQFEEFLDSMFPTVETQAGVEGDGGAEGSPASSSPSIDSATSTPSTVLRPRALLEAAQNPSLPPHPVTNPTWRDTLRSQWELMHDPAKGGVLGEAMQSLEQIMAGAGLGDADADEGAERKEKEWMPQALPLMVNHLMRDHLQQALAIATPLATGYTALWAVDAAAEESALPSILAAFPEELLSPLQRAVKLDQRARRWATSLLSLVLSPPPTAPSSPSPPTDPRALTALLRPSPLPRFRRALSALLALPTSEAHPRPFLSKHEMAFVVFGNKAHMERNGKEGVGRVAVEWARRKVEEEKRALREAEEKGRVREEL
ncbi:hypothetical protein JCM8097_001870 [Rhodosporidiobolus ruineniae]